MITSEMVKTMVNDALGHGYEVMESWKTDSGIVVVLGRYRFGAV